MNLRSRRKSRFGESSSASDMAFLLIIYFIVIAGFNVNKGFLMNLPAKDSTRMIKKDDLLRFELDDRGTIHYQGQNLSAAEAEQNIAQAVKFNPNLAVILTVSPRSPWQHVVSFVESAQRQRVDSFSFTMAGEGAGGE